MKSFFVNEGYIGHKWSERAQSAYDEGRMPKSKWTKSAIVEAVDKAFSCDAITDAFRKVSKDKLFDSCCFSDGEWHHTGMFYNQTTFYSFSEEGAKSLAAMLVVDGRLSLESIEDEDATLAEDIKGIAIEEMEYRAEAEKERLNAILVNEELKKFNSDKYFVVYRYHGNNDFSVDPVNKYMQSNEDRNVDQSVVVVDRDMLTKEIGCDWLVLEMIKTARRKRTHQAYADGDMERWFHEIIENRQNEYIKNISDVGEVFRVIRIL